MRRLKPITTLLFLFFLNLNFAQISEEWSVQLNGTLSWHKITSSGYYLVATNKGMHSYEQENGQLIWSNPSLTGFLEHEVQEMSGSPLLVIEKGGATSVVDPFDGSVRFNSRDAGIAELTNRAFLYKSNGILVAGKTASGEQKMLMVDNNNAKIAWTLNEKFSRIISINELSSDEIIVTTLFYIYKISTKDGSIKWKNSVSAQVDQVNKMGAFGNLLKDVAENMAKDADFVIRYYQNTEKGIFIIASETASESQVGTSAPTIKYENIYTAYKIADGSRVWKHSVEMSGKLGDLVFYENGVIVLPDDGNNSMINFYEFADEAKGKWGKNGRGTKIKGGVYSHVITDQGILLITKSGNNNFLNLLNPATGELRYDKPVKIDGEVAGVINTSKGIVYITSNEVNMIDPASGSQFLSKSISTTPALTYYHENKLYVFDLSRGTLKYIDVNNSTETEIMTDKLKFEGKEQPTSIELRSGGILISSEQNLAMYDLSGNLKFQQYFKAPRESGLKRALLLAQAARAAYISANAYAAAGILQAASHDAHQKDAVSGAVVDGLGMAYEELGRQGSEFAKKAFQNAQARFKATAEGRFHNIVLTEVDKTTALLKVSKDSGEVKATIDLGKEKEPKYAVDDVTGRVLLAEKDSKIICYQF